MVILFFSVQQIALFSMDILVIRPKRYVTNKCQLQILNYYLSMELSVVIKDEGESS